MCIKELLSIDPFTLIHQCQVIYKQKVMLLFWLYTFSYACCNSYQDQALSGEITAWATPSRGNPQELPLLYTLLIQVVTLHRQPCHSNWRIVSSIPIARHCIHTLQLTYDPSLVCCNCQHLASSLYFEGFHNHPGNCNLYRCSIPFL